jgi:hypothetical protein
MTPDFRLTQGNLPNISAELTDDTGAAVDLTGCSVRFIFQYGALTRSGAAIIVNPPGTDGVVSYQMASGDTDQPGFYQAQWEATYASGLKRTFPTGSLSNDEEHGRYIWFEIVPALPQVASPENIVQVAQMYEPVRVCLGDCNAQFQKYSDDAIASVVRTCLLVGKVPGQKLSVDRMGITPGIVQPRDLGLLMNWSAKMFLRPQATDWRMQTRALGEKVGPQDYFAWDLDNAIYDLENREMFSSFQTFYAWVNSLTGIDIWSVLSDMRTNAPVATVNIGRAGVTVSTT